MVTMHHRHRLWASRQARAFHFPSRSGRFHHSRSQTSIPASTPVYPSIATVRSNQFQRHAIESLHWYHQSRAARFMIGRVRVNFMWCELMREMQNMNWSDSRYLILDLKSFREQRGDS
ncbi:hypothetical protein M758_12G114800 [Ceratodon purpureus]|nr:hypothetical protein M758_12G114800 [Ceratodon purpureus]